jgi:hypothetical protein
VNLRFHWGFECCFASNRLVGGDDYQPVKKDRSAEIPGKQILVSEPDKNAAVGTINFQQW